MDEPEYLVFPFEIKDFGKIKMRLIRNKGMVTLSDEGKVQMYVKNNDISQSVISHFLEKYKVKQHGKELFVIVPENELKMAKDRLLQAILGILVN
ncbi:DUF1828 domain-containing protein [Companilactobacillus mishanensis]|uniref:DUF1828 domain-containing protein n=1 Tax=Companilactobacillus mishanensis TaxID=2486008 RepID=A0A5P0ZFE7_9LACO|nr:DUF1828 domain-containing protein [Companilactobacillus mishanensis]MQS51762.1 DUF1828 domain-containing protein [Companilactobacillus mishanensis]